MYQMEWESGALLVKFGRLTSTHSVNIPCWSWRRLISWISHVCNSSTPERLQRGKSASGHQPVEQDEAGRQLLDCETSVQKLRRIMRNATILTWPGDINSLMTLLTTSDAGKKSMRTCLHDSAQRLPTLALQEQSNLGQNLCKQLCLSGTSSPHTVKEDRHLFHHLKGW